MYIYLFIGGIGIILRFEDDKKTLAVVNAHLAAHQGKVIINKI